ncbi:hypothetical protein GCM10009799_31250 [Nocardiopsis rhodophaea]|uniref:Uncharacterized protein n=1 Tax=Nocardiopsis rhodophaea TaxID=280238 RepID=A0ABN2T8N3_9ACTN
MAVITNYRMKRLLEAAEPISEARLPLDLRECAEGEWGRSSSGVLTPDGPPPSWTARLAGADPEELMKAELDVNDIRVDDEDLTGDPHTYLSKVVARGFLFAGSCLLRARNLPEAGDLRAVMSTGITEDFLIHGTTVKFFLRRGGLPKCFHDVEGYKIEGLAPISIDDLPVLGFET